MPDVAADICTDALHRIGSNVYIAEPLASASSQEGKACRFHYPRAVDALLAAHPWPFATRRSSLGNPIDGLERPPYAFAYYLPEDFLNDQEIETGLRSPRADQRTKYVIESHATQARLILLTNAETVTLRYTARVDANVFHPAFREALVVELAYRLAGALQAKRDLMNDLRQHAAIALREAAATALAMGDPELEPGSSLLSGFHVGDDEELA